VITDGYALGEATTTKVDAAGDGPEGPQDARAGARPERTSSDNATAITQGDAPWSHRAGRRLRGGASATFVHPARWAIWDRHPASARAVMRRCEVSRLPRFIWFALAAWTAFFSLVAVTPRNSVCFLLAACLLVAVLTLAL
jgi:hypothetical protein